jgi:hypothetical protein
MKKKSNLILHLNAVEILAQASLHSGPKIFDQFYGAIKNYKLPGKIRN